MRLASFAVLLSAALKSADSLQALGEKDAVLASAYHYPAHVGRNFICSLRRASFTGDIWLFIGSADKKPPVDTYNLKIGYLPDGDNRVKGRIKQIEACQDGGYRYCLLADYRDVYFQRNPFSRYPVGKDLVFAQESSQSGTIGTNTHNANWMGKCIGQHGKGNSWWANLWKRSVVCSGTIAGTPAGLMALGEAMNRTGKAFPKCLGGPLDQAMVNVILHWHEELPSYAPSLKDMSIEIQEQGKGMINTIGSIVHKAEHLLQKSPQGEVLESDGVTVSAVVHQYDRSADLLQRTNERFESCAGFDKSSTRTSPRRCDEEHCPTGPDEV